jgi:hypothetical protein
MLQQEDASWCHKHLLAGQSSSNGLFPGKHMQSQASGITVCFITTEAEATKAEQATSAAVTSSIPESWASCGPDVKLQGHHSNASQCMARNHWHHPSAVPAAAVLQHWLSKQPLLQEHP